LLRSARCAVAVAPRGLCAREDLQFTMIGVEYDGEPEAADALRLGAALARAAGAWGCGCGRCWTTGFLTSDGR
jgi:hypothetical protein